MSDNSADIKEPEREGKDTTLHDMTQLSKMYQDQAQQLIGPLYVLAHALLMLSHRPYCTAAVQQTTQR